MNRYEAGQLRMRDRVVELLARGGTAEQVEALELEPTPEIERRRDRAEAKAKRRLRWRAAEVRRRARNKALTDALLDAISIGEVVSVPSPARPG